MGKDLETIAFLRRYNPRVNECSGWLFEKIKNAVDIIDKLKSDNADLKKELLHYKSK